MLKFKNQRVIQLYFREASNSNVSLSVRLLMLNANDKNKDMYYYITETFCRVKSNPGINIFDANGKQLSNVVRIVKSKSSEYPVKAIIAYHIFKYMMDELGVTQ